MAHTRIGVDGHYYHLVNSFSKKADAQRAAKILRHRSFVRVQFYDPWGLWCVYARKKK